MGKKNIQSGTEEFELFRDYWNLYKNNALVENNAEYFEKSSAGHGEIFIRNTRHHLQKNLE